MAKAKKTTSKVVKLPVADKPVTEARARTFLSQVAARAALAGNRDTASQLGELLFKALCPTRSKPDDLLVGAMHLIADELQTLELSMGSERFDLRIAEDILTAAAARLRVLTELHIAIVNVVDEQSSVATTGKVVSQ
jgi:hypothetical protein